MKASDIYRKAAELLDENRQGPRFACHAISAALEVPWGLSTNECARFAELFNDYADTPLRNAWLSSGDGTSPYRESDRPVRVLALLLMSEISRGEK